MHTTLAITPLAQRLMAAADARRAPNSELPSPNFDSADWISTQQAADITGYSRRHIQTLCEQGFFIEGTEWKQRPPRPGSDQGGRIRIKKSALKKLEGAQ